MLNHFCTLFNSSYLSRGLALYYSLVQTKAQFQLTVFAFDEAAFNILTALQLPHVKVIALSELEASQPELLRVKPSRTLGEYCWTCTSATIYYCLETLKLPSVCYLDADLYFWEDPATLLAEIKDESVLLTLHRFTPQYDKSDTAGKYCVQFMWFKNDARGLKALTWWRDACIEWCFDRVEPGRFGDQKYLDDWTVRFEGVKVLDHLGGGVAPWNVQQYTLVNENDADEAANSANYSGTMLAHHASDKPFELVFYHFHALKFVNNKIELGSYKLTQMHIATIYKPYINALLNIEKELQANPNLKPLLENVNYHGRTHQSFGLMNSLKQLKKSMMGQNTYINV